MIQYLAIGSRRVFVGLLAPATILLFHELYRLHSSQSTQPSSEYQCNADVTLANRPITLPPLADHTPKQQANRQVRRRKKAQVFDIIPINHELDQLENRLNELNTVVDSFVIIKN
ncbi:hypothetical protein EC957_008227 [Mortierella hygrophila]|uniref:Uncharacterized protein n=1 Tax=Mortierella hygrophila TaxID=979708 RepID=A0A9P6FCD8_9FUNG|nr:hypothetical protein EC957_008227 [Mortierella hygrophila]